MNPELLFLECCRRVEEAPADRGARAELVRIAREAGALEEAIVTLEESVLPALEGEERGAALLDLADCHDASGEGEIAARLREEGLALLAG